MIEAPELTDPSVRMLDQSRIGAILEGEADALFGGPPVTALLIQNTNPVSVAPDQNVVKRGFARDDLFICVHEQFMTETAAMADIVLPATMFMEHDDVYQAGGSQYILLGPKLVDAPGECRSNHDVICGLAQRLGVEHEGFDDVAARADRLDAEEFRLGRSGKAGARALDRLPAAIREGALSRRLQMAGRKVPLQAGLADGAVQVAMDRGSGRADAGLPDHWEVVGDRGCRASVPACDLAGAAIPQLDLQRDAGIGEAGRAPDPDDASGRCGGVTALQTATGSRSGTGAALCVCTRNCSRGCGAAW